VQGLNLTRNVFTLDETYGIIGHKHKFQRGGGVVFHEGNMSSPGSKVIEDLATGTCTTSCQCSVVTFAVILTVSALQLVLC